jgi:type I restriction enzyme S subunit
MTGTANVALKEADVAKVTVPLPPIEEQLKTIARLETMGERVQSLNEVVNTASESGRQLIASAFADITKGTSYSPISLVAPIVRRKVALRSEDEYPELGIRSFGKGTFHKPAIKGSDLGGKKLFQILPGDVVFNNVFAWEGAVAVAGPADFGRFGSHRFITCVPRQEVMTAQYLTFYFNTAEGLEKLGKASPGGAGRNRTLGLESLAQIEVPVPPFNKQKWFGELLGKVEQMQRIRASTQSAIRALAPALWSSVLPLKCDD